MFIKIKTLEGSEIQLKVELKFKVGEVKKLLEEKEAISVEQQRLIYAGKQLLDTNALEVYNIKNDEVLHLVLALRGGATACSATRSTAGKKAAQPPVCTAATPPARARLPAGRGG